MQRREFLRASSRAVSAAALGSMGSSWIVGSAAAATGGGVPAPGRYPFGLSRAQEQRAARLHRESIVFDAMSQGPSGMNIFDHIDPALVASNLDPSLTGGAAIGQAGNLPFKLAIEGKSDILKTWWDLSGLTVSPHGISPRSPAPGVAPRTLAATRTLPKFQLPWLRFAVTAAEIRQAKRDGVYVQYGYCQPVTGLPREIESIDDAYNAGLRTLMLTYNRMDYVGGGCTERIDVGLSSYGVQVVERCNALGLIVDTSHCGRQTTLDACKFSKTPVLANHACASGVYNHARGKDDDELRAIADTGGVIGVVVLPAFLTDKPNPTIDVTLDHIDYIARKVGWEHVGIGTDHPMAMTRHLSETAVGRFAAEVGFRPEDGLSGPQKTLIGYEDGRDLPNITRGLVKRGYSDEQIKGILGENFMRVFEQVCG